ncbi:transposase-like zinc-binding domain-containing protein [Rodentibacter rarus]
MFCQSPNICKFGIRNNIQHYRCNECHKMFSFKEKLDPIKI